MSFVWNLLRMALVQRTVTEEVTYPRMVLTATTSDPCKEPSMPYDHLLTCGHLILTATPSQPCGRNCYHVGTSRESPEGFPGAKQRTGFHCKACTEERKTDRIRQYAFIEPELKLNSRHCYIAIKTVSV